MILWLRARSEIAVNEQLTILLLSVDIQKVDSPAMTLAIELDLKLPVLYESHLYVHIALRCVRFELCPCFVAPCLRKTVEF